MFYYCVTRHNCSKTQSYLICRSMTLNTSLTMMLLVRSMCSFITGIALKNASSTLLLSCSLLFITIIHVGIRLMIIMHMPKVWLFSLIPQRFILFFAKFSTLRFFLTDMGNHYYSLLTSDSSSTIKSRYITQNLNYVYRSLLCSYP